MLFWSFREAPIQALLTKLPGCHGHITSAEARTNTARQTSSPENLVKMMTMRIMIFRQLTSRFLGKKAWNSETVSGGLVSQYSFCRSSPAFANIWEDIYERRLHCRGEVHQTLSWLILIAAHQSRNDLQIGKGRYWLIVAVTIVTHSDNLLIIRSYKCVTFHISESPEASRRYARWHISDYYHPRRLTTYS